MKQTALKTVPRKPVEVPLLELVSRLERARAVTAHILESLPGADEPRETAYAKLDHAGWLITAAEGLLDEASTQGELCQQALLKGERP
jgi:hypothetical protein